MLITGALALHKDIFKGFGQPHPGPRVLMSVNDTFGTAMSAASRRCFPSSTCLTNWSTRSATMPQPRNLSVEVAKAKATKADLLLPVCRLNDGKLLIQEMVKQRWEPMGVLNPVRPASTSRTSSRPWASMGEFLVSNVPWLDPKSAMNDVAGKHHLARFPNDQLDLNGGFTFEGLLIAAQAWLAAKSTQPAALNDALHKTRIDQHVIIGGPIQFDAKGQNVNIKAAAVENLKRKPYGRDACRIGGGALVFPMPGWNDKRRV